MTWRWPLDAPRVWPDAPGRFGAVRRHDVHTGVDLYCPRGTTVRAVEDGRVLAVEWFTGQHVRFDGVPAVHVRPGDEVRAGDPLGVIDVPVLKKDKGRPTVMLHLELYAAVTPDAQGAHTVWWRHGEEKPADLLDPTPRLRGAY